MIKMRRILHVVAVVLAVMFVAGCKDKKVDKSFESNDTIFSDTLSVETVDSTIYGRCGDGTSMHSLEFIKDGGDTVYLGYNTDTIQNTRGGLAVGDRLAVIVRQDEEFGAEAELIVNLTTLLGKWTALDKSFELQEGGVVVSTVTEPKPLTEWKINNGRLVLGTDTFDIFELGADTLMLENSKGIFSYKRLRAKQDEVANEK